MDIKKPGYYGRMSVSGIAIPFDSTGSVMEIITSSLAHLRTLNPRTLASGSKSLTIQISDRPVVGSALDSAVALTEISAALDTTHVSTESPHPGETLADFQLRLVRLGYSSVMATVLAGDAFGYDNTNAKLTRWIEDEKAVRFRYLNASERAAEEADSSEYAILKSYCQEHFAEFLEHMHVRR